jgi:hypothetical protein
MSTGLDETMLIGSAVGNLVHVSLKCTVIHGAGITIWPFLHIVHSTPSGHTRCRYNNLAISAHSTQHTISPPLCIKAANLTMIHFLINTSQTSFLE